MHSDFLEKMSLEEKKWMAYAIGGMIVVDGAVDEQEVQHVRDAIDFLSDKYEIEKLITMIKKREIPFLETLQCDRSVAFEIISNLATTAVADGKFKRTEADYLKKICFKLGFDPSFSLEIMSWVTRLVEVQKERKKLADVARNLEVSYGNSFIE